jgi:hypothetical protein
MSKRTDYTQFEALLKKLLREGVIQYWLLLTPGQYRLNDELDIFPKSRKFFYVPTKERGEYQDLEDFICSIYL